MSREPAVLFGLVAAIAAAGAEAIQAAQAGGAFNVWTLIVVGVPLLAAALTRAQVVPVEAVKDTIARARSASAAVTDLADRVDLATTERPREV